MIRIVTGSEISVRKTEMSTVIKMIRGRGERSGIRLFSSPGEKLQEFGEQGCYKRRAGGKTKKNVA